MTASGHSIVTKYGRPFMTPDKQPQNDETEGKIGAAGWIAIVMVVSRSGRRHNGRRRRGPDGAALLFEPEGQGFLEYSHFGILARHFSLLNPRATK
jgi:hypothetical protein